MPFDNRKELQEQYDLLSEKLARLRREYIIETDVSVKFKLEKQIQETETQRDKLEKELENYEKTSNIIGQTPEKTNGKEKQMEDNTKSSYDAEKGFQLSKGDTLLLGGLLIVVLLLYIPLLFFGVSYFHKQIAPEYGSSLVYIAFGTFSLIASIILFGFLKSSGVVKNSQYRLEGAAAFCIVMFGLLMFQYNNQQPKDYTFEGIVLLDNTPVTGARVHILEPKESALTEDGKFSIPIFEQEKREFYTFRIVYEDANIDTIFPDKISHKNRKDLEFRLISPPPEPPETAGNSTEIAPEPIEKITISGSIKSKTDTPQLIPNATIVLSANNQEIKRIKTDSNGKFSTQIPKPDTDILIKTTADGYYENNHLINDLNNSENIPIRLDPK